MKLLNVFITVLAIPMIVSCAPHSQHKQTRLVQVHTSEYEDLYVINIFSQALAAQPTACKRSSACKSTGELCNSKIPPLLLEQRRWAIIASQTCQTGYVCIRYGYRDDLGKNDERNPTNINWGFCKHISGIRAMNDKDD